MIGPDILLQVLATVLTLFISLLPITYMSWRDRLIESARAEGKIMNGLGGWMLQTDNITVHFKGPFKFLKIEEEIDINKDPKSITELGNKLNKISPIVRLENLGNINPESSILDGLNRILNKSLKRGFRLFIGLLIIDSVLLLTSVISISGLITLPFDLGIDINTYMTFSLMIGLFSYLAFAATMFNDRRIRWDVPPRLLPNGKATVAMLDTFWHQL